MGVSPSSRQQEYIPRTPFPILEAGNCRVLFKRDVFYDGNGWCNHVMNGFHEVREDILRQYRRHYSDHLPDAFVDTLIVSLLVQLERADLVSLFVYAAHHGKQPALRLLAMAMLGRMGDELSFEEIRHGLEKARRGAEKNGYLFASLYIVAVIQHLKDADAANHQLMVAAPQDDLGTVYGRQMQHERRLVIGVPMHRLMFRYRFWAAPENPNEQTIYPEDGGKSIIDALNDTQENRKQEKDIIGMLKRLPTVSLKPAYYAMCKTVAMHNERDNALLAVYIMQLHDKQIRSSMHIKNGLELVTV